MITERTLKRWRKEALENVETLKDWDSATENTKAIRELSQRILTLTQELLDQHLLRRNVR